MKSLTVITICLVFIAVVWARPDKEKYEDFGRGINIDEVLNNDRLRKSYLKCFKTGVGCTAQAKKVKDIIPEAMTTRCSKCTDTQKEQSKKVLRYTLKHHPEEFLEIEKIYDPERKYRVNFAKELADEGIVLPD